ncbi:MAG: monothiol glutaredoxin, Grx4 family [Candidatus Cloacimonadota bacterium]|nr:MAG: monothiol glutaredoxin, Grx4 family [Candidatus Cloacimonadota bacterium]
MTSLNVNNNDLVVNKSRANGNTLNEELESMVNDNEILLFMKGNRQFPQCGFSAHVVGLISQYANKFVTVDILADQEIRQGMKEFSNWPTFPQLYVKGKFVGGCDIMTELEEDGEFKEILVG